MCVYAPSPPLRRMPVLMSHSRKTGITLEDKGVRDEYGMEPVSGIFSSPEKSPVRRNDDTVSQSEPMDLVDSM